MRIPFGVVNEWRPEQTRKTGHLPGENVMPHLRETDYSTRIRPGTIIVFGRRRAHEVVEIKERPLDLRPQHFEDEWTRYTEWWTEQFMAGRDVGPQPEKATWKHRPLVIALRPADQPNAKPQHYAVRADRPFYVLPEHYSVCRLCNEVPPCTHVTTEARVEAEMAKTETLMSIPAGCCLSCGEPITSRMKAVRFPGPNLWRPDLGDHSAVFHARQDCADSVRSYRRQWEQKGHEELQPALPTEDEGDNT
ncbi:hypothetical protein [Streptomyces sp. NPDC006551]|uniref:hypothetical protein n=1 Tax=Streptomyces sp. NPDC006551 TaxID=3157178 RepID=UPI0033B78E41